MKNEAIRTEVYRGFKINFYVDEMPESPREWDNFGKMVCFHKRYDLGDKHDFADADALVEFIKEGEVFYLPLYLYDHSGITMSTSRNYPFNCPWDSGQVGYIYADKDMVRKEFGKRITETIKNKVYDILAGEVATYDTYIRGDVYGYVIEDADGEQVEGLWGIYDDIKDTIVECQKIIDAHIRAMSENKHFPKVEVFATKTLKFRARIREDIESPSYEVTVGGEEWNKGKGKNHEKTIRDKMAHIVGVLLKEQEILSGEFADIPLFSENLNVSPGKDT